MSDVNKSASATSRATPSGGLKEIVRQFTPNWFTATMGTGITGLAINQFPVNIPGLHVVGTMIWIIDIVLFTLFSGLYLTRWIFFFEGASRIFGHSVVSMFFGAIPMGLATILNGFIVFGPDLIGMNMAISIATYLWWIDLLMAVVCGVFIPFLMFTHQNHSIEKMTAVWLLPVVAAEVTAASAGLLVPHLADMESARRTLVIGYALWAFSVPLAMSILGILVLRLALHKLPHRDMASTGWLALGPIGTGALGLLLLGVDAPRVFSGIGMASLGEVASGLGIIGGLVFWGYGVWWFLLAVMTTVRYLREGMPFNIGWWGFTFPIGVYAVATLTLGRQIRSGLFLDIGGALVVALTAFWLIVSFRTIRGALNRSLFFSPCLITGAIPGDFEAGRI